MKPSCLIFECHLWWNAVMSRFSYHSYYINFERLISFYAVEKREENSVCEYEDDVVFVMGARRCCVSGYEFNMSQEVCIIPGV